MPTTLPTGMNSHSSKTTMVTGRYSKHKARIVWECCFWMSHPTWPSFVWQTYDYYFDPTAAYFGSKKGSEPLHIQWNPLTDNVEVVNYSAGNAIELKASVEVLNMDGARKW